MLVGAVTALEMDKGVNYEGRGLGDTFGDVPSKGWAVGGSGEEDRVNLLPLLKTMIT